RLVGIRPRLRIFQGAGHRVFNFAWHAAAMVMMVMPRRLLRLAPLLAGGGRVRGNVRERRRRGVGAVLRVELLENGVEVGVPGDGGESGHDESFQKCRFPGIRAGCLKGLSNRRLHMLKKILRFVRYYLSFNGRCGHQAVNGRIMTAPSSTTSMLRLHPRRS